MANVGAAVADAERMKCCEAVAAKSVGLRWMAAAVDVESTSCEAARVGNAAGHRQQLEQGHCHNVLHGMTQRTR